MPSVAAVGGHAAPLPWRRTKMFWSVTVDGSIALLNVIVTVRPLIVVLVITGEVVSASVNLIVPEGTRSLPSSDSTGLAVLMLWIEKL